MSALDLVIAWQYPEMSTAILIVVVLAAVLWIPYFMKEIRKGKVSLSAEIPDGASEPHPGRRGNPAPGHPEAQADPYDPRASR